jgi:hypothetical protein
MAPVRTFFSNFLHFMSEHFSPPFGPTSPPIFGGPATTHKSRSFPVTSLTRATGAGPIPSTVAVFSATSVNPLYSNHQRRIFL